MAYISERVYQHLPDNILLQHVRQKDLTAFNELYYRLAPSLLETAFQKTNDRPQSQDMVQELFIWLWEQAATLGEYSLEGFDVRGYLFTALRNKIYNHYHRRVNTVAVICELQRTVVYAENNISRQTDFNDLDQTVESELSLLPAEMQKIFRLRKQEGLSIKEIALQLVLSEQTVKNQLYMATRRLRLSLQKVLNITVILIQYWLWYFCFLPLLIV
ncbi:RNA polymerase sigma factor [Filimonas effusa]|uniref:RNA polymerase sigma factor n=1 Tax=Filimonas effusa TaxID=2508721 RepID=UPI0013E98DB6|nr:sigma-70 family RNA polymerase sigma factor [Filimonas effusa]